MPLYKIIKDDSIIGIWKIDESLKKLESIIDLNPNDFLIYKKLTSLKRKKEWLATRILLLSITGDATIKILYNGEGKPFLSNKNYISISHTNGFVAVIISQNKTVGIDIQIEKEKIEKGAYSFLTPRELKDLQKKNSLRKIHLYWCAKEAIYKKTGDSLLNIYSHIFIHPFDLKGKGRIEGTIIGISSPIKLSYHIYKHFYLVWTISP